MGERDLKCTPMVRTTLGPHWLWDRGWLKNPSGVNLDIRFEVILIFLTPSSMVHKFNIFISNNKNWLSFLRSNLFKSVQIHGIRWIWVTYVCGPFGWVIRWAPLGVSHREDRPHRTGFTYISYPHKHYYIYVHMDKSCMWNVYICDLSMTGKKEKKNDYSCMWNVYKPTQHMQLFCIVVNVFSFFPIKYLALCDTNACCLISNITTIFFFAKSHVPIF